MEFSARFSGAHLLIRFTHLLISLYSLTAHMSRKRLLKVSPGMLAGAVVVALVISVVQM